MLADVSASLEQNAIMAETAAARIAGAEIEKQEKIAATNLIMQAVGETINSVAAIFEGAKQRELSAVGQNEEKRAAIEKKYAKRRKALAINQAIIQTALAVLNGLNTMPFLPMGPIMAAVAGAMGAVQIAAIAATPLAQGGLAYGSTLANVGEYTGARTNPEVIAPLDKLKNILGTDSQGSQMIQIEGIMRGNDMYWVNRRQTDRIQRVTG